MVDRPVLLWLRQDLRLSDHPALVAATRTGQPVIPVYIFDEQTPGRWSPGGASRWWLGMSLPRIKAALEDAGSGLVVRRGAAVDELVALAREVKATGVYFSRSYEPWAGQLEDALRTSLASQSIEVHRYPGTLLLEPEAVATKEGRPFRVFSAFARAVMALPALRSPVARPARIASPAAWPPGLPVTALDLLPTSPDWASGLRNSWQPGEVGAEQRLAQFVDAHLATYQAKRDRPDADATSRLSPHLHFGELSPAVVWDAVGTASRSHSVSKETVLKFRSELLWREFSHHLLHHYPQLPEAPLRAEFDSFPWRGSDRDLRAWQQGRTGYPIVDAGMRELWQTGYMHNRVRMIVASFLVKDLLVPWQKGAKWFWDTLVDADLANNSASWQWVAGSGADAAPYFRIFNPIKQGRTFDPDGNYVRRFVPELAELPPAHLHAPFEAPASVLEAAGVKLGTTYPDPIVDHGRARLAALEAFSRIKGD